MGDFQRDGAEGLDGVDATGREKGEGDVSFPAELQHRYRADEIVVEQLVGTRLAIHSGQHRGIRGGVDEPIDVLELGEIAFRSDIAHPGIDPLRPKWFEIRFRSFPGEIVDPADLDTLAESPDFPCQDGANEAAEACN